MAENLEATYSELAKKSCFKVAFEGAALSLESEEKNLSKADERLVLSEPK